MPEPPHQKPSPAWLDEDGDERHWPPVLGAQPDGLPADLPEFIAVDLSSLKKGTSLHVKDVTLPKGVTAVTRGKENPVLVSVVAPAAEAAEAAPADAAAAPAAGKAAPAGKAPAGKAPAAAKAPAAKAPAAKK